MRARKLALAALGMLACLAFQAAARQAAAQEAAAGQAAAAPTGTPQEIDLEKLREERKRAASRYPVNPRISRYLGAAAEAVDEEDPAEAKRLLLKLRPNRLNPYERALVYRMLAYVAYGADDPKEAVEWFEKVLAEEVLPIRDEARIRFNIAQLEAQIQEWAEVVRWLKSWQLYTDNPDPLGYYLMGIAYYQLEDYDAAIEAGEKAVDATDEPKEAWLRLLAALFSQKEDFASATPVLEELVLRYPKKQYWLQLSLIYGARDDHNRSLAVQQVAYSQGYLTEDKELRRLARSYLYRELPYPAAKVLEKGLADGSITRDSEALELLANSWIAAREYDRALEPLAKAAALSEDGNLYLRLGQVHMQREEWSLAADELQKALEKGGLKNPGNAQLLIGISYYNAENPERARSSFVRARDYDATRQEAERWITHIETESNRG